MGLIESIESETGVRVDDPDDERARIMLLGAVAQAMRIGSRFPPGDRFAIGTLMDWAERRGNEMLADLLRAGLDPEAISGLKERLK